MRLVQFQDPQLGRRVGVVDVDIVHDVTSQQPGWTSVYAIFQAAQANGCTLEAIIEDEGNLAAADEVDYGALWDASPGDPQGWLLTPLDHPDPAHTTVGGTGLTHLGSMDKRNKMHTEDTNETKSDSQRMFEMGLGGGKPAPGERGISPECFYMGNGLVVRGHREPLDIPNYAKDGGEEPEIVGCYVIGDDGQPYRLGFAQGNEWADHATERVNYLWLAPSKLRDCAIGPELVTDEPFQDIRGRCTIVRGDDQLYDSGELLTGEENMCHSLANMEDHHFKYHQHRAPGDVHLYFFGTMALSFDVRGPLETGDTITVAFDSMGKPLLNPVRKLDDYDGPIVVKKG